MKNNNTLLAGCIATLAATSAATVEAALYNVDFGGGSVHSGAAILGSAGDTWNGLDGSSLNAGALPLVNSNNVDDSITISIFDEGSGGAESGSGGAPLDLMDDYIRSNINGGGGSSFIQQTFTLAGFEANSSITVYVYGASAAGTDRGSQYFETLNGPIIGSITGSIVDINDGSADGNAYTSFSLTTDGSGMASFSKNFLSGSSTQAPVNGLQIQGTPAVPEPGVATMLGLALTGFTMRRRRRGGEPS